MNEDYEILSEVTEEICWKPSAPPEHYSGVILVWRADGYRPELAECWNGEMYLLELGGDLISDALFWAEWPRGPEYEG